MNKRRREKLRMIASKSKGPGKSLAPDHANLVEPWPNQLALIFEASSLNSWVVTPSLAMVTSEPVAGVTY